MWKYFSPPFLFRAGALLYLYLHGALYFRESLSTAFTVLSFFAALVCGILPARSRLRLLPALAVSAVLPWLLRGTVHAVLGILASTAETAAYDNAALGFERHFRLLLPFFLIATGNTLLYFRAPRYRTLEPAIFGLFLVPLFWAQGNYSITLYSHPLSFAISLFGFLILGLLQTLITTPAVHTPAPGIRARRIPGLVPPILVLGLLLAWIFGRYGEASVASGGGLLKPGLFRFDFSNYLTLESEIRLNRDLILLYRRDEPIDRYLLRRFVLDGYKPGAMFFQDPEGPDAPHAETVPDGSRTFPPRETEGRRIVGQELYLVNIEPSALITLDYPVSIVPFQNWKDSSFTRIYKADALAFGLLPFELSEAPGPGLAAPARDYYLSHGKDPKIREFAEEITEGLPAYYDKVQAINDYLKYDYYYSLKPGVSPEGNQLHHFLFSGKKGYCSYFAFSMALLCRSIGIPARVAVGFYLDPESEVLGFYPVRSDMAHAWVEVHFEGYGWIDFDPTSETVAPGEEFTLDSGFEKDKVISLLEEIISNRNALLEENPGPAPSGTEEAGLFERFYNSLKNLLPYGWAFAGVLAAMGLVLYRLRHSAAARLARDRRRKTTEGFLAILQDLAGLGYPREEKESPEEYVLRAEALSELPLEALFALYQKARFAEGFDEADTAAFRAAAAAFRRAIRNSRSLTRRVLRWVRPSAFGGGE